ncbi:acyl-CoA Delta-9 desaturase isoform X1 [Leptinotarsa decemlineata]|uniref:acyl-CoA Delta-9 desaturase isoform X1 n=2 Tax=Leptinotarsa decemlineata TaxID=7539 RepID=UPI003D30D53B
MVLVQFNSTIFEVITILNQSRKTFNQTNMAPNTSNIPTGVLHEHDDEVSANFIPPEVVKPSERKLILVWRNIILFAYLHAVAVYGLYLMFTSAKLVTSIYGIILYQLGGLGVTAGAHRLWAHRSYKAKWPLKVLLTAFNTLAFENSVIEWARDHRVHHKFSETDADPHNAKRGFFFSHVGWLLCRKHPEVKSKGKGIDMSDLEEDPILKFQDKHYMILMPLVAFVIPTLAPMYFWNETFVNSLCINIFRYVLTLNATWLVNSAAHLYGHKPYDRYINPAENLSVSILALGEGWHNYHHTFPWDYKTSELGKYSVNFSAAFIDFFAKIGWAYDLKTVSEEMIKKRVLRTGDGSHEIWGWGDKDQLKEDYDDVVITHKKN